MFSENCSEQGIAISYISLNKVLLWSLPRNELEDTSKVRRPNIRTSINPRNRVSLESNPTPVLILESDYTIHPNYLQGFTFGSVSPWVWKFDVQIIWVYRVLPSGHSRRSTTVLLDPPSLTEFGIQLFWFTVPLRRFGDGDGGVR
jgi:hypothetical protein